LRGIIRFTNYYITAFVKYVGISHKVAGTIRSAPSGFGIPYLREIPVVNTLAVHEYTKSMAIVGGYVMDEGSPPALIERGVYWGLSSNPEVSGTKIAIGNGLGTFSTKLTGLNPNTNYYIKAYATNSSGTGYGLEYDFNTGNDTTFPKIADIDGNVYHIIKIGYQYWMAENLRTTKYNDGTSILRVIINSAWNLTSGAYGWYNNDSATYEIPYGKLYNGYAVNSGKLCPTGWHVPSDAEWKTLGTSLGGENIAGGKLKETGSTHWSDPNIGATNEFGFSALPGGYREWDGISLGIRYNGYWWSTTEYNTNTSWFRTLSSYTGSLYNYTWGYDRRRGLSVRCVKN
jgi:uncharacterized protein (TIGR02145 family)